MRVRVDEPGEEKRIAESHNIARRRRGATRADVDDASVLNTNGAVGYRRLCDGQDPLRRVETDSD